MKFKFVIKPKDTKVFTEFLQNIQGDTFKVGEVEVAIKYDVRSFIFICDFGSLITHKELENADGIYESVAGYVRDAVDKINTNKSKKRRDAEDAVINLFSPTKEKTKVETKVETEIDKFLNMFGPMFAPTAKTAVNKPIDKTKVSSVNKPIDKTKVSSKDTYFEDLVDEINKDSLNLKEEMDEFLNMFGPMFAPTAKTAVNKPIDKTKVSSKDTYFEDLVDKINKDSLNLVGKENKKETKYFFEKGVEKTINDFLEGLDLKGNKEDKPFSMEDWK